MIIDGNQTEHIPHSYQRYLVKSFMHALKLEGTPVVIEFKTAFNPYS